jgi:hypothetical protein
MKKGLYLLLLPFALSAADNVTVTPPAADTNITVDKAQLEKHVKEQLEREENFARTQTFLKGDDYNLSEHQVDPKDLEHIQVDPPEYDFDMNDVYD